MFGGARYYLVKQDLKSLEDALAHRVVRLGTLEVPAVDLTFKGLEAGRIYVVLDSVICVQLQI